MGMADGRKLVSTALPSPCLCTPLQNPITAARMHLFTKLQAHTHHLAFYPSLSYLSPAPAPSRTRPPGPHAIPPITLTHPRVGLAASTGDLVELLPETQPLRGRCYSLRGPCYSSTNLGCAVRVLADRWRVQFATGICCAGLSPQREGDPPRHTDSSSTTAAAAAAAAASASCASMPVGASCMETGAAVSSCGTALNPEWELVEGGGGQADWEFVDKDCPAADDDKVYIYLYMCV